MKNETTFYNDASASLDMGLRKYMLNVFSYMSAGLALTAIFAYMLGNSVSAMSLMFSSPGLALLLAIIPFGIVLYMSVRISEISSDTAKILFFVYSACIGVTMAPIFAIYTQASIAYTFFVTSAMFLSMVIYGYTTGKDLTGFGAFLFMGLIGLILASLINLFLRNTMTDHIISVIGVFIFTGLTAYDSQRIKNMYLESEANEIREKKAVFGALALYMDFINLFLYILKFLGKARDR